MNLCPYDPTPLHLSSLGMFHCPYCGEMVVAGLPHPDYNETELAFREAWQEAMNGEALPISELWEEEE